jgi:hypothetical protein
MIMGPNDPRGMRRWTITFTGEDGKTASVEKFCSGEEVAETLRWLEANHATIVKVEAFQIELSGEAVEIIQDFFAFEAAARGSED